MAAKNSMNRKKNHKTQLLIRAGTGRARLLIRSVIPLVFLCSRPTTNLNAKKVRVQHSVQHLAHFKCPDLWHINPKILYCALLQYIADT